MYDQLAGRSDWPKEYDGRNVVNKSIVDHNAGMNFEKNKKLYGEALKMGDNGWGPDGRLTAYVGSAVGLVREIAGAGEILITTREEAKEALDRTKILLSVE